MRASGDIAVIYVSALFFTVACYSLEIRIQLLIVDMF